jgi:hypothetical protein
VEKAIFLGCRVEIFSGLAVAPWRMRDTYIHQKIVTKTNFGGENLRFVVGKNRGS